MTQEALSANDASDYVLGYGNDSGQMTPHFIVKLIEGVAERFGT